MLNLTEFANRFVRLEKVEFSDLLQLCYEFRKLERALQIFLLNVVITYIFFKFLSSAVMKLAEIADANMIFVIADCSG